MKLPYAPIITSHRVEQKNLELKNFRIPSVSIV